MLDVQHRRSDEVQAVRELSKDLEPPAETAAEITAGTPPSGSATINNLTITKVIDKSTPYLYQYQ